MLVFWKERLVFLAMPKTGTTALEGALAPRADMVFRNPPEIKHAALYRYRRRVLPLLEAADGSDFETMAVLREPVSWLSSWYRYRHRDDLAHDPRSTRGISFDDFVRAYLDDSPPPYANIGSQSRFVANPDGSVGVTHLFRYESPIELADFLSRRLGQALPALPYRNVSPQMETSLSPGLLALLRDRHAAEFTLWEQAGAR